MISVSKYNFKDIVEADFEKSLWTTESKVSPVEISLSLDVDLAVYKKN